MQMSEFQTNAAILGSHCLCPLLNKAAVEGESLWQKQTTQNAASLPVSGHSSYVDYLKFLKYKFKNGGEGEFMGRNEKTKEDRTVVKTFSRPAHGCHFLALPCEDRLCLTI